MASEIQPDEFAALMGRFAPFERRPTVAVGVSGGADSLCLAHLAHAWAQARNGAAIAVTVDHGLRPEAADEARQVAQWMAAAGIAHAILSGTADAAGPAGNVQAAARGLRLGLLEAFCRDRGILHLLLAHHRDDQVETLLQRLARGSGVHGLAAIVPEKAFRHVRVLRPLLDLPPGRMAATLAARRLPWIEDPSNRDRRFDRVRLRQALAAIAADDARLAERVAHTAGAMRRSRRILDRHIDRLLARSVTLSPLGFAEVDGPSLLAGDRDLAARGLGLLVATVGTAPHPPRRESMLHWLHRIADPASGGATLAGAQLSRWREGWLVHREAAAAAPPLTLAPGERARWDDRFDCELDCRADAAVTIAALRDVDPADDAIRAAVESVPVPVRPSLPVARVLDGAAWLPHLNAGRKAPSALYSALKVAFSPPRPMTDPIGPGQRAQNGGAQFGVDDIGA
ncbi:MAG: tRNA lysidine(34) synthetase TilS [Alphaproteobacteria bacterium]